MKKYGMLLNVIPSPCHIVKDSLAIPPFDLGFGWIMPSHSIVLMQLLTHALSIALVHLISRHKRGPWREQRDEIWHISMLEQADIRILYTDTSVLLNHDNRYMVQSTWIWPNHIHESMGIHCVLFQDMLPFPGLIIVSDQWKIYNHCGCQVTSMGWQMDSLLSYNYPMSYAITFYHLGLMICNNCTVIHTRC